jgi:hypothetical protein
MSEEDVLAFGEQIHSGFKGQAMWKPAGDHEELVIMLHPDAVNYLPPGVYVIEVGNRYHALGPDGRGGTSFGVKMILGRDLDSTINPVLRGGVKKETTIWTSRPEGDSA